MDQVGLGGSAALSPNGEIIATDSNKLGYVLLWDKLTGTLLQELSGHTWFVASIVFSPRW